MGSLIIKTSVKKSDNIDDFNINYTPNEILFEREFDDSYFSFNIEKYLKNKDGSSNLLSVVKSTNEDSGWRELVNDKSLVSQDIDLQNSDIILYLTSQTGLTPGRDDLIDFDEKELRKLFVRVSVSEKFTDGKPATVKNILIKWKPCFNSKKGVKWKWDYFKGEESEFTGLKPEEEEILYKLGRFTSMQDSEDAEKKNIFSLASTTYSLAIWNDKGMPPIYDFGAVSKFGLHIPFIEGFSNEFNQLIISCLDKNPNNRPRVNEIPSLLI